MIAMPYDIFAQLVSFGGLRSFILVADTVWHILSGSHSDMCAHMCLLHAHMPICVTMSDRKVPNVCIRDGIILNELKKIFLFFFFFNSHHFCVRTNN